MKEENEKAGLKLNIQRTKIMPQRTLWQIEVEKKRQTLYFWDPKTLWMVTASLKLNDRCSLEGRL